MKAVIEVNHLWKTYSGQRMSGYRSLRETLAGLVGGSRRRYDTADGVFHALQDITFSVPRGTRWGIIGRNGAGKSTLLKILSGITLPSRGEATLRGKVSSLLEVGTGFHPELTGRENIYFNGAVLGMTTAEIRRSLDDIIDFSGVAPFIDVPLKKFSSGMQMRLAFSVAAHLRTDIILMDEVLTVGDAAFQKQCLGKMEELGREEGKTAIVVSHDLAQLNQLCTHGLLLEEGQIACAGDMQECIHQYTKRLYSVTNLRDIRRSGNGAIRITGVEVSPTGAGQTMTVFGDITIRIEFEMAYDTPIAQCRIDVGINTESGRRVAWLSTASSHRRYEPAAGAVIFQVSSIPLRPGQYDLTIFAEINHTVADWIKNVSPFHISFPESGPGAEKTPPGQGDILLTYKTLPG